MSLGGEETIICPFPTLAHTDARLSRRPALCLMCGELVCFASECCRRVNVPGASDTGVVSECFAHSVECGAGDAMRCVVNFSTHALRNWHHHPPTLTLSCVSRQDNQRQSMHVHKHTHTHKQTNKQTTKQTNKHTHTHTHTHKSVYHADYMRHSFHSRV